MTDRQSKRPETSIPLLLASLVSCLVAAIATAASPATEKIATEKPQSAPVIKDIEGWAFHIAPKMLASHLQGIKVLLPEDRLRKCRQWKSGSNTTIERPV